MVIIVHKIFYEFLLLSIPENYLQTINKKKRSKSHIKSMIYLKPLVPYDIHIYDPRVVRVYYLRTIARKTL